MRATRVTATLRVDDLEAATALCTGFLGLAGAGPERRCRPAQRSGAARCRGSAEKFCQ